MMINIDLGKFDHDLTVRPKPGLIMVYVRGIIPSHGRKIQISELFFDLPRNDIAIYHDLALQ